MVFEITDITVHPGEKMPGSRSARRAIGFSDCPCGRRVQFKKGALRARLSKIFH
jgi:hypothetical protein